jgi:hypothetical protein
MGIPIPWQPLFLLTTATNIISEVHHSVFSHLPLQCQWQVYAHMPGGLKKQYEPEEAKRILVRFDFVFAIFPVYRLIYSVFSEHPFRP